MERAVSTVDIEGTIYKIDLKNEQLIPNDVKLPIIDLKLTDTMMEKDWKYMGYYDLDSRKIIEYSLDITEMPSGNIVGIVLPSYKDLDPVAFAELHGHDFNISPEEVYPKTVHHKAEIIPIEKTDLAILIEENNIPDELIAEILKEHGNKNNKSVSSQSGEKTVSKKTGIKKRSKGL